MPQTLFQASGLNPENADKLRDAGMNVAGVKWVNINVNNSNIVVTHEDNFDASAFTSALQGAASGVTLSN
ncbi:MAG: hypothetical protein Q4A74_03495 [Cardiobacteriaceae bacterium]|nr:hypothetical protein [Cardiobacteriaceae bacterium]